MCFSATVSYGASAILVATGIDAVQRARGLGPAYRMMALTPILFGIQQAFEGRVWQMVDAGAAGNAVPYALGFLFFSHFLWLWWIPLSSYLAERKTMRKRLFVGITIFGAVAGSVVYITMLLHPGWLSVVVEGRHIVYNVSSPYRGPVPLGIPPSALYGVIILAPLLLSSHRHLKIFGGLIAASMALASVLSGYALVSVWCFFAAVLSLYLVVMLRTLGNTAATG